VQAPLAAHLVLEVLDGVGHEYIVTRNTGLFERAIENPAGRTDERFASQVFLIAGLLAHKHQARAKSPLARNNLRCRFIEQAAHATGFCVAKSGQRFDRCAVRSIQHEALAALAPIRQQTSVLSSSRCGCFEERPLNAPLAKSAELSTRPVR
jgi:hypothetical protein